MRLKDGFDIHSFVKATENCTGQIFFHTSEGDILNIKSLISEYLMVSILCNKSLLKDSQVICTQDEDYQVLKDFLE